MRPPAHRGLRPGGKCEKLEHRAERIVHSVKAEDRKQKADVGIQNMDQDHGAWGEVHYLCLS
jgi:hypothetical protein